MADTTLGNALEFFGRFGVYDVLLPFLLVFAVVYAILEKTKLFGTEKIGEEEFPKKNINAVVAFAIALMVVAATRVVDTILTALPQVSLMVIVGLSFLLMIGIFAKPDGTFLESIQDSWYLKLFGGIMFAAVALIFLNSIPTKSGESWLEYALSYVNFNWSGSVVGSIILVILFIFLIWWITKGGGKKEEGD